ncbi:MAG: hypothetical protein ABR991_13450 [Terracidiphilus sp.]|jgi:hypothetical protein
MNPVQLGFRNLFGTVLPGAMLVLVLMVCLEVVFPGMELIIPNQIGDKTIIIIAVFLLFSYIFGSVIRLYSADTVDRLSASLICIGKGAFEGKSGSLEDQIKSKLEKNVESMDYCLDILQDYVWDPKVKPELNHELMRWAWKNDSFPYPVWEVIKFRLYHPDEMFEFFLPYKRCFATGERRGKEFFNFCKAVIFEAHDGNRHALAEEVQSAEANARFFAGVFWALLLSALVLVISTFFVTLMRGTPGSFFWMTSGTLIFIAAAVIIEFTPEKFAQQMGKVRLFWIANALAVLLLLVSVLSGIVEKDLTAGWGMNLAAICMVSVALAIIFNGRFRLVRLKEVDSVFDAFFLVNRRPDHISPCSGYKQGDADE